jgi:O-antigen/teichoic acid export membrane protein
MTPDPPAGPSDEKRESEELGDRDRVVQRSDLKEATLTSVRWVASARVGLQVIGFVSSIVLARLISPAEFGRAAIAMIVVALSVPLGFQAFGSAVVRFSELGRRHVESACFLSLMTGVALTGLTLLLAPFVIQPVLGHREATFFQIVAPVWLLSSLSAVPFALLQRRMDFRRLSIGEVGSTVAGLGLTLALAFAGVNGEAILAGALATTALSTAYALAITETVRPRWYPDEGREVARYGWPIALSSLFHIGFLNIDYAIIGARLGARDTGIYWRAYQVAYDYQGKVSGILQRIAFPLFSRTSDLNDMKRLRARISRVHATVLFGPILLLIPIAPVFIPLLFGDEWDDAVLPTQILVPIGLVGAVTVGIGPVLTAAGRAGSLLVINGVNLVLYAALVYFAAPHGLTVVCACVAGYDVITIGGFYVLMQRLVGIPAREFFEDALPGLVAGAGLLAVAFPITELLMNAHAPRGMTVICAAMAGGIAYCIMLRILFPATWSDVTMLLRRALPRARFRRSTSVAGEGN